MLMRLARQTVAPWFLVQFAGSRLFSMSNGSFSTMKLDVSRMSRIKSIAVISYPDQRKLSCRVCHGDSVAWTITDCAGATNDSTIQIAVVDVSLMLSM
jgi:hypothetical protein